MIAYGCAFLSSLNQIYVQVCILMKTNTQVPLRNYVIYAIFQHIYIFVPTYI